MIAKRVRARRPDIGMLPEVQWISANDQALTDVIRRLARSTQKPGPGPT